MPLALGIIAVLALVIAIRGNYQEAGTLFNSTFFSGSNGTGFLKWFGSILGIAVIFRIMGAPRAGQLFIALLILVYFMENNGIVAALESAIQSGAAASQPQASNAAPTISTTPSGTPAVSAVPAAGAK